MQMKSPRVANALGNVQLLRPRQLLREFALDQAQHAESAQQAEHMAKLIVAAGRELFGYLQVSLQGPALADRYFLRVRGTASRHGDSFTSASDLRLLVA
eukprot:6802278-Alexandrium_andersonii.AAC.1